MAGFFFAMFAEMGARRRRLRVALCDRGQSIAELLVLGGLMLGSLCLFAREWMTAAAPRGFAQPVVFLNRKMLIEYSSQAALARDGADPDGVRQGYDWITLLWSFGCALAGAAAFVVAWSAEPAPPAAEDIWTPPENSVPVDISP
jgi:hypothetical protein